MVCQWWLITSNSQRGGSRPNCVSSLSIIGIAFLMVNVAAANKNQEVDSISSPELDITSTRICMASFGVRFCPIKSYGSNGVGNLQQILGLCFLGGRIASRRVPGQPFRVYPKISLKRLTNYRTTSESTSLSPKVSSWLCNVNLSKSLIGHIHILVNILTWRTYARHKWFGLWIVT